MSRDLGLQGLISSRTFTDRPSKDLALRPPLDGPMRNRSLRSFFGLGGGVPVTPFGSWSYDFSEEQTGTLLADCPPGCVLVSHSPPKGAVDVSSSGRSLGSEAVRDAILRVRPSLVVCGHIHACAGRRATVGTTPVVNAGPEGIEWVVDC